MIGQDAGVFGQPPVQQQGKVCTFVQYTCAIPAAEAAAGCRGTGVFVVVATNGPNASDVTSILQEAHRPGDEGVVSPDVHPSAVGDATPSARYPGLFL